MAALETLDPKLMASEEEDTQKDKFLTFHLGEEEYAVSIGHVTEIIGLQKITPVPEMSDDIKGVINLRGKIIPLMDIRLRFRMAPREYDERTCVIVVNFSTSQVGLIVDGVSEVVDLPETNIEPISSMNRNQNNLFLRGIGKLGDDIKIVIDVEKLLFDRTALLQEASKGAA